MRPLSSAHYGFVASDHPPYGQLRELRKQNECHRKDSKAVLETCLVSMYDQNSSTAQETQENKDTPDAGTGGGG